VLAKRVQGNYPPEGSSRVRLRRTRPRSGRDAINPPEGRMSVRDILSRMLSSPSPAPLKSAVRRQTVSRKGHEIVAFGVLKKNPRCPR